MNSYFVIPILITSCIVAYDYHFNPTGWYDLALFFLPLTMLLSIVVLRRLPSDSREPVDRVNWKAFTRRQMILSALGFVCFMLIAQVQGTYPLVLGFLFGMHHAHQFALLILGIFLITWGMSGGLSLSEGWRLFRRWTKESDAKWLLLIILLGLFVRTVALGSAIHFYLDEVNFASPVMRLRSQANVQIMNNIGPVANFTWIYAYLEYYYTELFGATLVNLRAVSVIFGTLTIPVTYLLGKWTFNRRIGLLASFLLAFYLPHIHYSRLAINNIADPLFGIMAIALLWRGLQTRSRAIFALAGLCLGLTSYFYEGGRLLYPPLIIGWLAVYVFIHQGRVPKRGIGVFLATSMLIASGFYLSLSVWGFQNVAPRLRDQRVDDQFWAELLASSNVAEQVLRYLDERLNPAYLHIVSQPDGSGYFYSNEVGLILPQMLPFLLIGFGIALFHWRRAGLIFLFGIVLTVVGNSLLTWNNLAARFVVLFPIFVLLIALGLDLIYRLLMSGWLKHGLAQRLFRRSMMALLLLMGIFQMGYYFAVMLPQINVDSRLEIDAQDAAIRAQSLPPDTQIYIFPIHNKYHYDVEVVQAYERHQNPVTVIRMDDFDSLILDTSASQAYAFFVVPSDSDTVNQLKYLFGNRLTGPQWSPYNVPRSRQFVLYQVSA